MNALLDLIEERRHVRVPFDQAAQWSFRLRVRRATVELAHRNHFGNKTTGSGVRR
ncbi:MULTISPECIES: hypothetical protein [unclassified Mycobacterium]|uniref:hypothetical protein n=1 Tax=unclassified Mycobacterium TaxID=2642494 RepID=UPI000B0565E8|nr:MULTISPECIES: hypothetical protein [unclassified Mycobacterium]